MDIRINLLPPELQRQQAARKQQRKSLVFMTLLLVLLSIMLGSLAMFNYQTRQEIIKIQTEQEELAQKIVFYKPYQEMEANQKKTQDLLKKALGSPPDYYAILEGLGFYIPGDIQLTSLEAGNLQQNNQEVTAQAQALEQAADKLPNNINPQEKQPQVKNGEIVIRGYATEANAVANFLAELQRIPHLTEIRCQTIVEEPAQGAVSSRFEIHALLWQPVIKQTSEEKAGE